MKKLPRSDGRARKDHYVPRGYLRGFAHPEREGSQQPLCVLDVGRGEWSAKSPSQIGWMRGFYDYSPDSRPDTTADDSFRRLENQAPRLRDRIRAEGYEAWTQHRNVLVSLAAMLAARSPLFRTQATSGILQSLDDEAQRATLAKNYSITIMRAEIERRSAEWQQYDWVLAYSRNAEHPFVASDQCVGMRGDVPTIGEAFQRNDFWLWCPLSWDMCLIGSSQPLTAESTTELQAEYIREIQTLTMRQAAIFVASPVRLQIPSP